LCAGLTTAVGGVAVLADEQGHVVGLALVDAEGDGGLGEEGVLLAKVGAGVEAQGPARGPADGGEDVDEGVDGDLARRRLGAVGQPDLDAAVVIGERLERLEGRVAALETHADALCGAAGGGVEDVAGDGVLAGGCVHGGLLCWAGAV
jgi:hypothetical protein